jgi:hypothetical protein
MMNEAFDRGFYVVGVDYRLLPQTPAIDIHADV